MRQAENLNDKVEPTLRVWTTGDLPTEKASTICLAINTLPEWVGAQARVKAQTTLLGFASQFSCEDLKRLANHIIEVIDPVDAEEHLSKQLEAEEKKTWTKTSLTAPTWPPGRKNLHKARPAAPIADSFATQPPKRVDPSQQPIRHTRFTTAPDG